jgi:hypothetical protein
VRRRDPRFFLLSFSNAAVDNDRSNWPSGDSFGSSPANLTPVIVNGFFCAYKEQFESEALSTSSEPHPLHGVSQTCRVHVSRFRSLTYLL